MSDNCELTNNKNDTLKMLNIELPVIDYKEKLEAFPDIVQYINTLHKVIDIQSEVLTKVRNVLTSAPNVNFKMNDSGEVKQEVLSNVNDIQDDENNQLHETSNNLLHPSNFVYEPVSGMYYDYTTGYYYDADLCLYYDGNTGSYYKYDETTNQYKIHLCSDNKKSSLSKAGDTNILANNYIGDYVVRSPVSYNAKIIEGKEKQLGLSPKKDKEDNQSRKMRRIVKSKKVDVEREDGECSDDSEVLSECSADAIIEAISTGHPAMRIIVTESSNTKIKIGTLFLVTCSGGSIGREGNHDIILPDINVSKSHLKFIYAEFSKLFYVIDMGSRNGTYLNGKRLSETKKTSEATEVIHGSSIQIGGITLLCHIHFGDTTCDSCEPGLVQVELADNEEKNEYIWGKEDIRMQHKRELQRLKKQYALTPNAEVIPNSKIYADRAKSRRNVVGIDNPHGKTEIASVDQSVGIRNKGYLMLSKMGWNSGEGLGKDGTGLREPVPLINNAGTLGLGMNVPDVPQIDSETEQKRMKWKKAQERYNQSSQQLSD